MQEKMLLDKLVDLAAKVRAVSADLDPGAQNNLVSDWLLDIDAIRERSDSNATMTALCIGPKARELACDLWQPAAIQVSFAGTWDEFLALDPFALGATLFGAHVAIVSEAAPLDENLKWLAEMLPVMAIVSRADAALPRSAAGNPQWLRASSVPLTPEIRRSLVFGALASRVTSIADALRRGVQSVLAADRVSLEMRTLKEGLETKTRRSKNADSISAARVQASELAERAKLVEDTRDQVADFLNTTKAADRTWPRELGDNPLTEIITAVNDHAKGLLEEAYFSISTQGQPIVGSAGWREDPNLSDRLYAPFEKLSTSDQLEFPASDAKVRHVVEAAHGQAFELAYKIIVDQVVRALRKSHARIEIDFDKLRRSAATTVGGGRARQVQVVLSKAQAKEFPGAGVLAGVRWGFAAVRPYMFYILAAIAALAASGAAGNSGGTPKVFIRLFVGLALGVVVAVALFPGKVRSDRGKLRTEYINDNTRKILEGLQGVVREIVSDLVQHISERVKTRLGEVEVELAKLREKLDKATKALEDEQRLLSEDPAQRSGFAKDSRAAMAANHRELERTVRGAFQDWARQFKIAQ